MAKEKQYLFAPESHGHHTRLIDMVLTIVDWSRQLLWLFHAALSLFHNKDHCHLMIHENFFTILYFGYEADKLVLKIVDASWQL